MPKAKLKLLEVVWEDSQFQYGLWEGTPTELLQTSIGFLVREDDQSLSLSMTTYESKFQDVLTIPKKNIKRRKNVRTG